MPPTKKGIYHNLKESVYTVSNGEIVFFFSSKLYLTKYIEGYKEHRIQFVDKFAKIASDNPLNMETLADITFYVSVEKRGFRAWLKGVDVSWREMYLYALRKMTDKNTQDWLEIQKPRLDERYRIME